MLYCICQKSYWRNSHADFLRIFSQTTIFRHGLPDATDSPIFYGEKTVDSIGNFIKITDMVLGTIPDSVQMDFSYLTIIELLQSLYRENTDYIEGMKTA